MSTSRHLPLSRRSVVAALAALPAAGFLGTRARAQAPKTISLDYAYYNPVSLLLKKKGWLEEEFAKDGTQIRWVLSAGSNKALEFLRGDAIDFGSTAGSAALVARANGAEIKSVYVYSKPEWTALVTRADTKIEKVADLKGKTVAVTRGTDPHIFLLRVLKDAGLGEKDLKVVLLQHPDGERALAASQVDAWAGLDPFMAKAEVEYGAKLFHRNVDYNTYGVLNVREALLKDSPDTVRRVLTVYEKARRYSVANRAELTKILAEDAKIAEPVAKIQLEQRTDISDPTVRQALRDTLIGAGQTLRDIGVLKAETDVNALVAGLLNPDFASKLAQL